VVIGRRARTASALVLACSGCSFLVSTSGLVGGEPDAGPDATAADAPSEPRDTGSVPEAETPPEAETSPEAAADAGFDAPADVGIDVRDASVDRGTPGVRCQLNGTSFRCAPSLVCCFIDNNLESDYCMPVNGTCVSEAGSRAFVVGCDDGADCLGSMCCMAAAAEAGAMNASTCSAACSTGEVQLCGSNEECAAETCGPVGVTGYFVCE
jgi:hypothetical protein